MDLWKEVNQIQQIQIKKHIKQARIASYSYQHTDQ